MKIKNFFLLLMTSAVILFNACDDNDAPGSKPDILNFDITEKTLDSGMQTAVFTGDKTNCFVRLIREILGSDTLGYHSFYYKDGILQGDWYKIIDSDTLEYHRSYHEKEMIEGDWYEINVDENVITVSVFENQETEKRELILNIAAGNAGKTLKIFQSN